MNAPTPAAALAATPVPLPDVAQQPPATRIEQTFADLPLDVLVPSPTNPRKRFDPATLAELAETIKKQGVVQPILVRPLVGEARLAWQLGHSGLGTDRKAAVVEAMNGGTTIYEIVAGERRTRASEMAGKTHIPALIRALTNIEVARIQTIENLQRDDLHELEEAAGYQAMIRDHGFTVEQLADEVGVSKETIYARLKLNDLRTECRDAFFKGDLVASTALLVARIPQDLQLQALKDITEPRRQDEPLSARAAAQWVRENYMLPIAKAPFDTKAADYLRAPSNNKNGSSAVIPIAEPCPACPKRTHAARDLFHDVQGPDMCTDPTCYRAKTEAHSARLMLAAQAEGTKVIAGAEAKKIFNYAHQRHFDGYQDSKDDLYLGGKSVNPKKVLGKDTPLTLIENPFTKQVIEVVDVEAAKRLLKNKGIVESVSSTATKQREQERKARLESQARVAILRETYPRLPLDHDTLLLLAKTMWHDAGHDGRRRALEVMGWEKDLGSWEATKQVEAKLAALDGAALAGVMVVCALVGKCFVNSYNLDGKPEELHDAAERAGVDYKTIRRDIVAAAKRASTPTSAARARTKAAAAKPAVGAALETAVAKAKAKAKAKPPEQKTKGAVAPESEEEKPGKRARGGRSLKTATTEELEEANEVAA